MIDPSIRTKWDKIIEDIKKPYRYPFPRYASTGYGRTISSIDGYTLLKDALFKSPEAIKQVFLTRLVDVIEFNNFAYFVRNVSNLWMFSIFRDTSFLKELIPCIFTLINENPTCPFKHFTNFLANFLDSSLLKYLNAGLMSIKIKHQSEGFKP